MEFFHVISFAEAKERMRDSFGHWRLAEERLPLLAAKGRFLAQDILAAEAVPNFHRSTVDGYAVHASATFGAGEALPVLLRLAGQVVMGEETKLSLAQDEAIGIPTGGMLPAGADSVVMIEHAEKYDSQTIAVYKPLSPRENVIQKGDDVKAGALLAKQGMRLDSKKIGILAACGIGEVAVYRPLRFAVISTGDEIIDLHAPQALGQIRDINSYGLSGLVQDFGGEVVSRRIVRDDYDALQAAVLEGLSAADVVLTSGGSSVGERDYTYRLIDSICHGNVPIQGIAVKPGKPTIVGNAGGKAIIGLPGHPAAALMIFRMLMGDLLCYLGLEAAPRKIQAALTSNLPSAPGKTTYQMVTLKEKEGKMLATPVFGKSGMITMLSGSDGYIEVPQHIEGLYQGQQVQVELF